MSKTLELPGVKKVIRARVDLSYKGKEIRGIRRVRVDGKLLGEYEVFVTAGETAEVDQAFAKEAVMSGKAELVEGGMCSVAEERDGYHRYSDWRAKSGDKAVFEKVEFLKNGGMAGGPYWGPGFQCRLDISEFARHSLCYLDEPQSDAHVVRVLRPSPKQTQQNAVELATRVGVMWKKLYPDTPTAAT